MEDQYLDYVKMYGLTSMAVIMDRLDAVQVALEMSKNPVLLVLTGKGHEKYLEASKFGVQSDQDVAQIFRSRPISYSV